ncbi:MAG: hypothetical protein AB8H86_08315 [Polyangiales bacterium]
MAFREAPPKKARQLSTTWGSLPATLSSRLSDEAESLSGGAIYVHPSNEAPPSKGLVALALTVVALILTYALYYEVEKLSSVEALFNLRDLSPLGFVLACGVSAVLAHDAFTKLSGWRRRLRAAAPFVGVMVYPLDIIVFDHDGFLHFFDTTDATPVVRANMVTVINRAKSSARRHRPTREERRGSKIRLAHPELDSLDCPDVILRHDDDLEAIEERFARLRREAERHPEDPARNPVLRAGLTAAEPPRATLQIPKFAMMLIGVAAGAVIAYLTVAA